MRVIAYNRLRDYWGRHPRAKSALVHWNSVVSNATWTTPHDVLKSFSKAKVLNAERVRFEIEGGSFRLIAAFDYRRQIACVKFVGTHAEYDRIDAASVSQF